VRRNIKVGKRSKGGYECELDVVAFHPKKKKLLHYEPSTDTHSWAVRERRFKKKFEAGKRHIASLFHGLSIPEKIDQYAVFLYGSTANHTHVAGGEILMVDDFLTEVVRDLKTKRIAKAIVPEQFPLLRVLQLACEYRQTLFHE
jgi:hypothetical protein